VLVFTIGGVGSLPVVHGKPYIGLEHGMALAGTGS